MDILQGLSRDLATLWERFHMDNPDDKTSVSKVVKSSAVSRFDRLPHIELPSFNGEDGGWRPYWEKFNNALEKDPSLTNVDRLSFLLMTIRIRSSTCWIVPNRPSRFDIKSNLDNKMQF